MIAQALISCRAVVANCGDAIYSLHFELCNHGTATIELSTYEPFTAFSVLATSNGKPLTVHQPALDIPVNPMTIDLAPGTAVTLKTPIRLRISESVEPGSDGFLWTIAHAKETVSLQIRLDLPTPFAILCPVLFQDAG
jgi:hypothetical protein